MDKMRTEEGLILFTHALDKNKYAHNHSRYLLSYIIKG